jgi:hypothetical protein
MQNTHGEPQEEKPSNLGPKAIISSMKQVMQGNG